MNKNKLLKELVALAKSKTCAKQKRAAEIVIDMIRNEVQNSCELGKLVLEGLQMIGDAGNNSYVELRRDLENSEYEAKRLRDKLEDLGRHLSATDFGRAAGLDPVNFYSSPDPFGLHGLPAVERVVVYSQGQ